MSTILRNIKTLACCKQNRHQDEISTIEAAAVVWDAGKFTWVGAEKNLPTEFKDSKSIDANNQIVVPGLIDCHTHLAFGGWRADEFEMRLKGKTYLEIAKAGGGILSTVKATREASEEELTSRASSFLMKMAELGVTTVECKSGYGLDFENEIKLLKVYQRLTNEQPLTIVSTFLGAHTVPAEFKNNRAAYLSLLIDELIPEIAKSKLANFCDAFVEDSAFSVEEAKRVLDSAANHGLRAKLHADQLTNCGGAALAAEVNAISADHLEQIDSTGIKALVEKDVVAVSLPLASLYTQQNPLNARRLIDEGVAVAVATDFNPGSAPTFHLPLAMLLSCNLNRLTPAEALNGATSIAARAIGLEKSHGSIEVGKSADLAILDTPSINHWIYNFQANSCSATIKAGEVIYGNLN